MSTAASSAVALFRTRAACGRQVPEIRSWKSAVRCITFGYVSSPGNQWFNRNELYWANSSGISSTITSGRSSSHPSNAPSSNSCSAMARASSLLSASIFRKARRVISAVIQYFFMAFPSYWVVLAGISANLLYGFEQFNLQNTSRHAGIRHCSSPDHLVRLEEERRGDGEAERLGGLEV